jgi:CRP-like cAMP-binding protein
LLLRYLHVQFTEICVSGACNRLHEAEQRLARWLLLTSNRVMQEEFTMTQDFMAEMLGSRRATVTIAAGILQKAGLIEYRRGTIKIMDRRKLEEVACECYGIIEKAMAELKLR